MNTNEEKAAKIANDMYSIAPNYPKKAFHAFSDLPLIEKGMNSMGDLGGLWYEALYMTALNHPEKTTETQLYLVVAYRKMYDMLRSMSRLNKTSPSEWSSQPRLANQWDNYLDYTKLILEDNDDEDELIAY
jgi:hypothetical protein